jgi:acyl-CoA thioesterase FadM
MADVDAAGILYFASPLRWIEALNTEWFAASGHQLSGQLAAGATCPCIETTVRYLAPLRLDDQVDLELTSVHVGRTSFGLRMTARLGESPLAVEVRTTHVWAELDNHAGLRPAELPDWLRGALTGLGGPTGAEAEGGVAPQRPTQPPTTDE